MVPTQGPRKWHLERFRWISHHRGMDNLLSTLIGGVLAAVVIFLAKVGHTKPNSFARLAGVVLPVNFVFVLGITCYQAGVSAGMETLRANPKNVKGVLVALDKYVDLFSTVSLVSLGITLFFFVVYLTPLWLGKD